MLKLCSLPPSLRKKIDDNIYFHSRNQRIWKVGYFGTFLSMKSLQIPGKLGRWHFLTRYANPIHGNLVYRCSKKSPLWDFSLERWSSFEILKAQVANALRTPIFWGGKWWELAWRYCSVWVFFQYTWWGKELSAFLEMRTSRNRRQPSTSRSMVNFMELDWLLRCSKKLSNLSGPCCQME